MANAENEETIRGNDVHKKCGFNEKMARLMSVQEHLQKKQQTLWNIKNTLLKNRTTFSADDKISKNEESISMIDKSISKNDALLSKTKNSIVEIKDILHKQPESSTEHHAMKSIMLDANSEMVSWIMEGYAHQTEHNELSDLDDCLMTLMRQPSGCKISMDRSKIVDAISANLSDEMRHALFHDESDDQHRFSAHVEFLALNFIYGTESEHIYTCYDTIMQIGMHFLDEVDKINAKDWSAQGNKKCGSNGGTATSSKERVVSKAAENCLSNQQSPSAKAFSVYRDQPQPIFQFGKEEKFPYFLMIGGDVYEFSAVRSLKKKVEVLNEWTFSGLPFYIYVVVTRIHGQFLLSEYDRPIKELGKPYFMASYDGAARFLLAFLNLLPIFSGFQKILDARQLAWNVSMTSSSGIVSPFSERRYINNEEYVHHLYFQKKVDATLKGVSSWEDLLHIYTKLAEKPAPDSLVTPMKGQNLVEIFTSDAKTFTIRLLPVAFPGRAEMFLTSYRLVAQCFYDILSALVWLHAQNIVHRHVVGCSILKKICKKGFVLTNFEYSTRSSGKFSKDVRNDKKLPSCFAESGFSDTDQWFPWDDAEQLCMFMGSVLGMVSPSHRNLQLFDDLFDREARDSAYRKLIEINYGTDTAGICSEILHKIDACFKEYKSPF